MTEELELIDRLVKTFEAARRDERAYPIGHRQAAYSEHKLYLTVQEAKDRLRVAHGA